MAEQNIQNPRDETAEEILRVATERADRAEAELARLKGHAGAEHEQLATDSRKEPPSPSTAANAQEHSAPSTSERGSAERGSAERGSAEIQGRPGGEAELRKDPMMTRLLDALHAGTDIGHYGRLVFAMVARHFMPHEEVLAWMAKDADFSEEQAVQMLRQVDSRDYSPPRRERLMEWQREQSFQFMDASDPDSGNLYRHLEFPNAIYEHIESYQETKGA